MGAPIISLVFWHEDILLNFEAHCFYLFTGVTIFSIIFSVALTYTKNKGRALFAIFETVFEAVMKTLNVILW